MPTVREGGRHVRYVSEIEWEKEEQVGGDGSDLTAVVTLSENDVHGWVWRVKLFRHDDGRLSCVLICRETRNGQPGEKAPLADRLLTGGMTTPVPLDQTETKALMRALTYAEADGVFLDDLEASNERRSQDLS